MLWRLRCWLRVTKNFRISLGIRILRFQRRCTIFSRVWLLFVYFLICLVEWLMILVSFDFFVEWCCWLVVDSIYIYPSGHCNQANFKHICGFSSNSNIIPKETDLFVTSEIASILDLYSKIFEFVEEMWRGFSILRRNYASVILCFRLLLGDWHIDKQKLDRLYKRFMIDLSEEECKNKLIEMCKISSKSTLVSSEKINFMDGAI